MPPLKGGHIDLTEQNNEMENAKVSEEIVETQDVSNDTQNQTEEKTENPKEEVEAVAAEVVTATTDDDDSEDEEVETTAKRDHNDVPDPVHDESTFDWSMDKEGFSQYDDSNRSDLEKLYEGTFNTVEEGTIAKGKVVTKKQKVCCN